MIILEKMKIKNYRKFVCEEITFDEYITAIAGSNNSGKTSVVELLSNIFVEKKDALNIDDMHIKARLENEEKIKEVIENGDITREKKIEELREIHNKLNNIEIDITVKYTNDTDDLQLFSQYLADVDIEKRNFYFKYLYEYEPIKEEQIIEILDGLIDYKEIFSKLSTKVYYCDEKFSKDILIPKRTDFYNLFNVHCVYAIRRLSDTSDEKHNYLTKQLLNTVKNNSQWKNNLHYLIEEINKLLLNQNLSKELDKITVSNIKDTLDNFAKTNGGNSGSFGVEFKLERKDIEKVLLDFTHIYFEQDRGLKINESKQGLGYSNLVYLLLEIKKFSEKFDPKKVNLLIFEEPEAHLHPQMENVFIRYISALKFPKKKNNKIIEKVSVSNTKENIEADLESNDDKNDTYDYLQMIITTHSIEMTRTIEINKIRILRSENNIETYVYDLNRFLEESENELFYKKFFQFNIVDIIFADKAILFEGDSERLLLKYLIANDTKYESLSSQYISYIQVGGAYAYKYRELIEFLKIKTLIITDIDYNYDSKKDFTEMEYENYEDEMINKIKSRETTNETINKLVDAKNIENIFLKAKSNKGIYLSTLNICLKFQTEKDGYSRTLEDAILYNLANVKSVFTRISNKDFTELKNMKSLSIPDTKTEETTLRDRVEKLKNKTDFMYSLIESGEIKNAIPNYIKEGLDWLKD